MSTLLKAPSAYLPIAMSIAALALVLTYVAMFGIVKQEDEGTAAHIFQLLMVVQVPLVALFASKWLPRAPKEALLVLALQLGAAAAALAAVFWMES